MKTIVLSTSVQVGEAVGREICALVEQKPDAVLCLAAGHTSLETFDHLVSRHASGLDFSRVRIVELDEWLKMDGSNPESCTGFMQRHLFSRLNLDNDNIFLLNACAQDLQAECSRMEAQIAALGGIDYMFLGLGMNGHLGLNEPACDPDAGVHVAMLSETTRRVGQKYFARGAELTGGITLGLRNILEARRAVLAVTGEHKGAIVAQLLARPDALPAGVLWSHLNGALLLDEAAADLARAQGLV